MTKLDQPVKTYSLTLWIPALVVGIFSILFGIQLLNEYRERIHTLYQFSEQELYEEALQIAQGIEYALGNNDLDQANSHITRFALRKDAHFSALIGTDQHIRFSSFFAWNNQDIKNLFTDTEQFLLTQAQNNLLIQTSRIDNMLTVAVPLKIDGGAIFNRAEYVPILWVQTNIQNKVNHVLQTLIRQALPMLFAFLLATTLLIFFIRKLIIYPLAILNQLSTQLAQHHFVKTSPLIGNTSQAEVAQALVDAGQELQQHIEALSEREQRLETTLQSIGDAVIVTDTQGIITRMNCIASQLTGWRVEKAIGQSAHTVLNVYDANNSEKLPCPVKQVLETAKRTDLTSNTVLHALNGEKYYISESAAPIRKNPQDSSSPLLGVILVFQNVTQQYELQEELGKTVDFLQNLLRISPSVTYILEVNSEHSPSAKLTYITESSIHYSGLPAEYWIQNPEAWIQKIHPDDLASVYQSLALALESDGPITNEFRFRHVNGHYLMVQDCLKASPKKPGEPQKIVGVAVNITEQRLAEQKINFLAHHDALTHLPNRALLSDRIHQSLVNAERYQHKLSLLYLDLDRFKFVNDRLGHAVGDKLLINVAQRILKQMREQDTVCRTGGDEFIVLLPNTDAEGATHVSRKLIESFSDAFTIESHQLFISVSIGISVYPDNGLDAETLNKHADAAMYRAKQAGRNQYQFFTQEMHTQIMYRLELEHGLRFAQDRHELFLVYQPQIRTFDQKIIGSEALVRWQHPQFGLVSPLTFIPIAEETGLIKPLGQWILKTAISQCKYWVEQGYKDFVMAINLSGVQFNSPTLVDDVMNILHEFNLPAHHLELEITESVAMMNIEHTTRQLRMMADHGIRLSLDDFGTGYSSLNYLKKFPIDTLKIDQSFVIDMLVDEDDAAIVDAVITLAKALGLKTLAEGVETLAHIEALSEKGCDYMQGYIFSHPLIANEFEKLLNQYQENTLLIKHADTLQN